MFQLAKTCSHAMICEKLYCHDSDSAKQITNIIFRVLVIGAARI